MMSDIGEWLSHKRTYIVWYRLLTIALACANANSISANTFLLFVFSFTCFRFTAGTKHRDFSSGSTYFTCDKAIWDWMCYYIQ